MSDPAPNPPTDDTPAQALGTAWDLLDALPPAPAPASMTSTTVEMVAADARGRGRASRFGWLPPAATVVAAFLVGVIAGRATIGDVDRGLLDHLPVIEHFDVVREAGSVEFLSQVARRGYPPPRWLPVGRPAENGGDAGPPPYAALDAAVAAFASGPIGDAGSGAARRESFEARPEMERRRLVDAAAEFARLSPTRRRELVQVARALGGRDGTGPDRDELLAAARLWHQWLATRDPADRKSVIELDTPERLEWLERYAGQRPGSGRPRFNGRLPVYPPRRPPPAETPAPPR